MDQVSSLLEALVPQKGSNKSEVAAKLGISSQLLGQYMKGRQNPKIHFFNKWKEVFGEDLLRMTETNVSEQAREDRQKLTDPLPMGDVNITLKDYIDLLKYTNERLFATLNSTLGQIHSDQQVALAYQKAWVEYEAERASEGDESKKKKIMYKMSKLVDGKMKDKPSTGSPGETRK